MSQGHSGCNCTQPCVKECCQEEDSLEEGEMMISQGRSGCSCTQLEQYVISETMGFLALNDICSLSLVSKSVYDDVQMLYRLIHVNGFDLYQHTSKNDFATLRWMDHKGIKMEHVQLTIETRASLDRNEVLAYLVTKGEYSIATIYATRNTGRRRIRDTRYRTYRNLAYGADTTTLELARMHKLKDVEDSIESCGC